MDSFKLKISRLLNKIIRWLNSPFSAWKKKRSSFNVQNELDKKLVYNLSGSRFPSLKQLKYVKKFLSPKENLIIKICGLLIAVNLIFLGTKFYLQHLEIRPAEGGTYIEGLIGSPQYINPLYSSANDVDGDIGRLVFSSLFTRGENGELINDLTENYEANEDKKIYSFKIKENVFWHNGGKLTTDDILFTFNTIKDSQFKSPLRFSFAGVTAEKIDDYRFKFILSEPYAAFLELLTFGIIPAELWGQIPPAAASLASLNLKPVGSGPYKFKSFEKDKNGNIKDYILTVNKDYYNKKPFIEEIRFYFFPDPLEAIQALNENTLDGLSYLPRGLKEKIISQDSLNFYRLNIPQLNAIFLNQEKNKALAEKKLRWALALALDKNKIIAEVLNGEGKAANSPLLPLNFAYKENVKKYEYNPEEARKLLEEAGWKLKKITEEDIAGEEETENKVLEKMGPGEWRQKDNNFLVINLDTVEAGDNPQIAEMVGKLWQEVGVKTNIQIVSPSQIQTEILKNKDYEALFYGQIIGADPDVYAFWHSSQTGSYGLNIANFRNKEVDKLLEEARLLSDQEKRKEKYYSFQDIIVEELPAIFMYSPTYTYVQNKKIKNFSAKTILLPENRFANIQEWYVKTKKTLSW